MLLCHLYISFGEVYVKVFGQFFSWVVFLLWRFKNSYMFWITVLYQMSSELFSPSLWLVFSFY